MPHAIIRLKGTTQFINNYLLTLDDVIVIQTNSTVKPTHTTKALIVPPAGRKEDYTEKIIEGKPIKPGITIKRPKAIAIETPVEITPKMKQYIKEGGTIILFEHADANTIEIEQI